MSRIFKGQVKVADVQAAFDEILDRINEQVDTYNTIVKRGEDLDYSKGSPTLAPYDYTLSVGGLKQVMKQLSGVTIGCNIFRTADKKIVVSNGLHFNDNYTVDRLPSGIVNEDSEGGKAELKDIAYNEDGKTFSYNRSSLSITYEALGIRFYNYEAGHRKASNEYANCFVPHSFITFPYKPGRVFTMPTDKGLIMQVGTFVEYDGVKYWKPQIHCSDIIPTSSSYQHPYMQRLSDYGRVDSGKVTEALFYGSGSWSNVTQGNIPFNNGGRTTTNGKISFQVGATRDGTGAFEEGQKYTTVRCYDSRRMNAFGYQEFVNSSVSGATHIMIMGYSGKDISVQDIEVRDTNENTDFSKYTSYDAFDKAFPNIFELVSTAGAFNVYYDKSKNGYVTYEPANGYFIRNCNVHRETPYLNTGDFYAVNVKGLNIYSASNVTDRNIAEKDPQGNRFIILEPAYPQRNNVENVMYLLGKLVGWCCNQGTSTNMQAWNRPRLFLPKGVDVEYSYSQADHGKTKYTKAIIRKKR